MVRERVSITLPKECLEWIDNEVKRRTYGNRSHAIEIMILDAMKQVPTLIMDSEKAARLHKKEKPRIEESERKDAERKKALRRREGKPPSVPSRERSYV